MSEITPENRLAARNKPENIPAIHQDWRELLFLHWKYDPDEIQRSLPPGLFVDTFEGNAYVTVIPFRMENVHLNKIPPLPGFSDFIEINVRTYVYDKEGIPGIWFYSLDLNSFLGAKFAKYSYLLPYKFAELHKLTVEEKVSIQGRRKEEPRTSLKFTYKPNQDKTYFANLDTLDFFLIERYFLFSTNKRHMYSAQVHHQPYPITSAELFEFDYGLLKVNSFNVSNKAPDLIHYSIGVDVDIYYLQKIY